MTKQKTADTQNEYVLNTADRAREAGGLSTATVITALASFVALVFSGISLYQTVLKQADVRVYVPETISYARDPNGSFEVVALPVTVVNSGARDGVMTSMKLKVRNAEGVERVFNASFVAEPGYFSTKEDFRTGQTRPKRPFAPITIAGRSGQTSTVLFYPRTYSEKRVIKGEGTFSFELSWQDIAVDPIVAFAGERADQQPLHFEATLPKVSRFFEGQLNTGVSFRLFVKE
ncbi:MAG: hypothetical protein RIC14_15005 [Filomicrobium sp.]